MWKNGPSPSFGAFKKIMLMASRGKCIFHILFGHFIIPAYSVLGLHRCWLRILETKYVGDNFEMLVTVFAVLVTVFVTNIFVAVVQFTVQFKIPYTKMCERSIVRINRIILYSQDVTLLYIFYRVKLNIHLNGNS